MSAAGARSARKRGCAITADGRAHDDANDFLNRAENPPRLPRIGGHHASIDDPHVHHIELLLTQVAEHHQQNLHAPAPRQNAKSVLSQAQGI
jgi:hypothetical protein